MVFTSQVSPKDFQLPVKTGITSQQWEEISAVARKIFVGEIALLFSALTVMAGIGCLGWIVVYQAPLYLPTVVLLVVSATSGIFGQNLIDEGEWEKKHHIHDGPFPTASLTTLGSFFRPSRQYVEGQPIGLWNEGASCFINAVFQMIMNDEELARAIRESFDLEKGFRWIEKKSASAPERREIEQVMIMIRDEAKKVFRKDDVKKYPQFYQLVFEKGLESVHLVDFKSEWVRMKNNSQMKDFFERLERKLSGFKAFIAGEKAYHEAEQKKQSAVSAAGGSWWGGGTLLRDLRNLMPENSSRGQQDADELLAVLLNWVDGSKHPHLFFQKGTERKWEITDTQDANEIQKKQERHDNAQTNDDLLTLMPSNGVLKQLEGFACILEISDLFEGACGEELVQKALEFSQVEPFEAIYSYRGEAKYFKQVAERAVLEPSPERLIIRLKRFEYTNKASKINVSVRMKKKMKMGEHEYRLKSIVHHCGGVGGGHYTSYIFKNEKWWLCNDSDVMSVDDISEGLNTGYLYFYEKLPKPSDQSDNVIVS